MKTLLFSDLYPLPENIGTRMRTMNFVRFFNSIGDVDLVYRRTGSENRAGTGPFRKEYAIGQRDVPEGNERFPRLRELGERIRRLAERRPWIVAGWPEGSAGELRAIVSGEPYDIVLCRYALDSHPFLDSSFEPIRKRTIVDYDDVMSMSLFDTKVRNAPGLYMGMKRRLQREMLLSYQKRFLGFGAALFCSEEDRKEVAGRAGVPNAYIVPNTYPATLRIRTPDGSGYGRRRTLLFVGALDYGPNVAGLKWFMQAIYPRTRERYPDLRLLVVGRRPPESLVRLCLDCPGVELCQDVPDVGPYYEKCGAVVVPLLSGGGTRIKILEAAMAARPVLSTPIGAHGLFLGKGAQPGIFDDAGSFIERYGALDDEKRYTECVLEMHAAVRVTYSPEAFDKSMTAVVENLRKGTAGASVSRGADG